MRSSQEIIELTERVTAPNYAPLPVVISRGVGAWVFDVAGNQFLDCVSAYSALNQGHRHPRILRALRAQADRLTLSSRAMHNDQLGHFLDKLCTIAGMEQALPMNTGAEAVETAIKLARKWAYEQKAVPNDAAEIVVCRNNFHGRTTTIVGFSSEPQYRDAFGPFGPGFKTIEFNDSEELGAAISKNTAAVLLEPIQAEAGIIVPELGYLEACRNICSEHNVLFMLDEIQTGLGRTGEMFDYLHESRAKPDVLIVGKALGGGVYPVSAVVASRELMHLFAPGDHGSTFGGNPLAAAVASAALDVIVEEALPARAASHGNRLKHGLEKLNADCVKEVRGRGLLLGIEFHQAAGPARAYAERLLDEGVISKDTHAQVLRLAPPLVIEESEIDWLIERLRRVLF